MNFTEGNCSRMITMQLLDILFTSWHPLSALFSQWLGLLSFSGSFAHHCSFSVFVSYRGTRVCFCGELLFLCLVWFSSAANLLTPLLPMPGPGHFLFAGVVGGSSCSSSCSCGTKGGHFLGTFWAMMGWSVGVV